jgi:hypothetical protein
MTDAETVQPKGIAMCKRTTVLAFILLVLSGAVLLLDACRTVEKSAAP